MKTTIFIILLHSMGRISNNSISELISSHCYVFDNSSLLSAMSIPGAVHFQIDFLRFYIPPEKWMLYGTPWDNGVKDNPNYEPTEYQNVFRITDYKYSMYDYCLSGYPPVSVLRWEKVKLKKGGEVQELIQVCIYGKGLKLYYSGHLTWLRDFIIKYAGECTRVDLCWDFKNKIPGDEFQGDNRTDLKRFAQYLNSDASDYDTIYYGKKHSPFMIRIYNKTADLRKDKNIHAFLYPSRYMKECRRYEIELKGNYANSNSVLDWLDVKSRDLKIQKAPQSDRSIPKSLLFMAINNIKGWMLDDGEKIMILQSGKELINHLLNNLIHKDK